MRNIKAHMDAQQFSLIPGEFLSMRRLWPPASSDLYKRRTHEALLFRDGLSPIPATTAAATIAAPVDHSTEALQTALNALGATPPLTVDGIVGNATKGAVRVFQQKEGIEIDGIPGDETWGKIAMALAALPKSPEAASA
jgi:lysozyme family protein